MKALEDAFSSAGFRRVVLPGIVLTIGLHPLFSGVAKSATPTYGVTEPAVVLIAEVILLGLILSSCINLIYYVYEGFKLPWLTVIARNWNQRHLAAALAEYELILNGREFSTLEAEEKIRASLVHEKLVDYPLSLDASGKPVRSSERATALGNIIESYELYPKTRYHVDGVFYWYHLLALAPEAATKEFNENYAFAESLVLTSCAGILVALTNLTILLGLYVGSVFPGAVIIHVPLTGNWATGLTVFGVVIFLLFYSLALPAHREAGRVFRTVVDLGIKELDAILANTSAPLDKFAEARVAARKRYLNALKS